MLDYLGPGPGTCWRRSSSCSSGGRRSRCPGSAGPDDGHVSGGVTPHPTRDRSEWWPGPDPRQDRGRHVSPGRRAQPPRETRSPAMLDASPSPPEEPLTGTRSLRVEPLTSTRRRLRGAPGPGRAVLAQAGQARPPVRLGAAPAGHRRHRRGHHRRRVRRRGARTLAARPLGPRHESLPHHQKSPASTGPTEGTEPVPASPKGNGKSGKPSAGGPSEPKEGVGNRPACPPASRPACERHPTHPTQPTRKPKPSQAATGKPIDKPSGKPTDKPSGKPGGKPSTAPSPRSQGRDGRGVAWLVTTT